MKYFSLLLLALTVSLSNCQTETSVDSGVNKRVSIEEFKSSLASLSDVALIDVRTPEEYEAGHIEGAKNINFLAPDFAEKMGELDKTKPVMIYCQAGGRSAKALKKLKEMGFQHALELEGGYSSWH